MHTTTQPLNIATVENQKKVHGISDDDVIIASVFYRDMKYSFISNKGKVINFGILHESHL